MTYRSIQTLVPALAFAAATLLGQTVAAQEFIVAQQVVSDVKVDSFYDGQYAGDTVIDGSYSGDVSTGGGCANGSCGSGDSFGDGSGDYIGDMSAGAAGCIGRGYGNPDLFYNYYTKGNCNLTNAQMYISPLPVPPNVGHTFFTYQPFYPEEMLYWHKNKFHNVYDNGRGLNRTKATYFSPPVRQAASNLYWNKLRIPR